MLALLGGHRADELEPSKLCFTPGGFELQVSLPNQDPATHSKWLVKPGSGAPVTWPEPDGRDVAMPAPDIRRQG